MEQYAEDGKELLDAYTSPTMSHPARMQALQGALLQVEEGYIYGYHASLSDPADLGPDGLAPRNIHQRAGAWDVGLTNDRSKQEVFVDPAGVYFSRDPMVALTYFGHEDLSDHRDTFIYSAELPIRKCDLDPEDLLKHLGGDDNIFREEVEMKTDERSRVVLEHAADIWDELQAKAYAYAKSEGMDLTTIRGISYDGVRVMHEMYQELSYAKQRTLVTAATNLEDKLAFSLVYKDAVKDIQPNRALMMIRDAVENGDIEDLYSDDIEDLIPRYEDLAQVREKVIQMPGADFLSDEMLDEITMLADDGHLSQDPDLQEYYDHSMDMGHDEEFILQILDAAERASLQLELDTYDLDEYPEIAQRHEQQIDINRAPDLGL